MGRIQTTSSSKVSGVNSVHTTRATFGDSGIFGREFCIFSQKLTICQKKFQSKLIFWWLCQLGPWFLKFLSIWCGDKLRLSVLFHSARDYWLEEVPRQKLLPGPWWRSTRQWALPQQSLPGCLQGCLRSRWWMWGNCLRAKGGGTVLQEEKPTVQ